jgi:large subunit ribosomal protein L10
MNRQEKHEFVKSFRDQLQAAPFVVVAGYGGTPVNTSNNMRRVLEKGGVQVRIVKNTLAKLALEGTERQDLAPFFTGMTLVALTDEDPIKGAKVLKDAFGAVKTIEVRAGHFEGDLLDGNAVAVVSSLPSREELLVQLLRTIQEPARRVLGIVQAPARDLLFLLKNYENKLNEDAGE